jgi:hypothetical protein
MPVTKLDQQQVIQQSFDEANRALQVRDITNPVSVVWDYMGMTISTTNAANDTETYVFRVGGQSGTVVRTSTVVYTNGTRDIIVSVTLS